MEEMISTIEGQVGGWMIDSWGPGRAAAGAGRVRKGACEWGTGCRV